jgi:hypothetical protein
MFSPLFLFFDTLFAAIIFIAAFMLSILAITSAVTLPLSSIAALQQLAPPCHDASHASACYASRPPCQLSLKERCHYFADASIAYCHFEGFEGIALTTPLPDAVLIRHYAIDVFAFSLLIFVIFAMPLFADIVFADAAD